MLGAPAGAFLAHLYSPHFVLDCCVFLTAINAAVAIIGFRNGRLAPQTKLNPPAPKTKLPLGCFVGEAFSAGGGGGAGGGGERGCGGGVLEGGGLGGGSGGGGGLFRASTGPNLFLQSGQSPGSDPERPLLLDQPLPPEDTGGGGGFGPGHPLLVDRPPPPENTGGGTGYDPCSAVALLRGSTALQLIALAVCCYYLAVRKAGEENRSCVGGYSGVGEGVYY